jgi:hypothetical protein
VFWEASDRVCGKRLKALVPILVAAMERNGHLKLNGDIRAKILGDERRDHGSPFTDAEDCDASQEAAAGHAGTSSAHQNAHLCRLEQSGSGLHGDGLSCSLRIR